MRTKLSFIASGLFLAASVVFLGISILGRFDSSWPLVGTFSCLILANIINLLRGRRLKKEREMGILQK